MGEPPLLEFLAGHGKIGNRRMAPIDAEIVLPGADMSKTVVLARAEGDADPAMRRAGADVGDMLWVGAL